MKHLRCLTFLALLSLFLGGCETPSAIQTSSAIQLIPVDNPMPRVPTEKEIIDISRVSVIPRAIYQTAPQYPFVLRKNNIQGTATVIFIVGPDGSVVDACIVKATDIRFGEAAVAAIYQWRFNPGEVNGRRVYTRMMVPIGFSLSDH